MKSWLDHLFLGGLLATNVAGCGGLSPSESDRGGDGTDSNTHWLSRCDESSDCGEGLSCVCGVCSSSCTGSSSCEDIDDANLCVAAQCESGTDDPKLLCSQSCSRNADCAGDTRCEDGICLPEDAVSGEARGSVDPEPDPTAEPEPDAPAEPEPMTSEPEPMTSDPEPVPCEEGNCDYCYELDEGACEADPSCTARRGRRIDVEAMCQGPLEFATCAPLSDCDAAETVATDVNGQCWYFGGICYLDGFDYQPTDPACHSDQPECGSAPEVIEGCEALDATGDNSCDAESRYGWNGSSCEEVTCSCVGTECGRTHLSAAVCESAWAGCADDIPECREEDLPDILTASFEHPADPAFEGDGEFNTSVWTTATWHTPVPLPVTTPCVEGFAEYCAEVRGLVLTIDDEALPQIDVGLPPELWARLDLEDGDEIEFNVHDNLFATRDANTDELSLLIARGGQTDAVDAEWGASEFTFSSTGPVCTFPGEESDCNWLNVVQYLDVAVWRGDYQRLRLEPFSAVELTLPVTAGEASYRIMQGKSVHAGVERPNLEACAAFRTRGDGFAVARVKP